MLQEIYTSHHKKKKLIKAIQDASVMFIDENGDLVINAKAYPGFVASTLHDPLKTILDLPPLAADVEYLVIQ